MIIFPWILLKIDKLARKNNILNWTSNNVSLVEQPQAKEK